jgi:hypothetical protein
MNKCRFIREYKLSSRKIHHELASAVLYVRYPPDYFGNSILKRDLLPLGDEVGLYALLLTSRAGDCISYDKSILS